ncbi:hypothetical protein B0H11DRAFT_1911825 [Mycena galericulata]|nr:hypothetical protein B0H11DRAFT_1911825 [Mycena galericulata]
MVTTKKEIKKMEAKFTRRLDRLYAELDSMNKDMMAFFSPPDGSAPKIKKQVTSNPNVARKTSFEKMKSEKQNDKETLEEKIETNALEIPPVFEISEIGELRKPKLQRLLKQLGGPMNTRDNKEEITGKILSILEERSAKYRRQTKTTTEKKAGKKKLSSKTVQEKVKGGGESSDEPGTDGEEYEPATAKTSSGQRSDDEDYTPQAGTYYDEDDRMAMDTDEDV